MKKAPFLSLTFALCLGVIVSNILKINFLINISLFLFLIFTYFIVEKKIEHHLKSRTQSIILISLFFCLGLVRYSISLPENYSSSLTNLYLKNDVLLGQINSLTYSKSDYAKTEFQVKKIIRFQDTLAVDGKIVLFIKDEERKLKEFDVCLVSTELNQIKNKNNPGEFDAELFWKHKGIEFIAFANEDNYYKIGTAEADFFHYFTRMRNYFSGILDKNLTGEELAIAKGLILGDRSSIDSEITAKFGNTGAMHVLAVSGLHVGILVQILTLILSLFKRWISKNQSVIIALLIVWIYSAMTGFSASVARSAVMFTILAGSGIFNKSSNNFNVLAFSALIILMWNPHFLFDIGFQLSYLAMFGIFMFYTPLSKVLYIKNKVLKAAYDGTMVGISAQILTVPLTLYYFHQFPNYFIITNLGLMVFSFLILALGVALFSLHWIPFVGSSIAYLLAFSLYVMLLIIDFIDSLPGAVSTGFVLNTSLVILLFATIIYFFFSLKNEKIKQVQISLLSAVILCISIVYLRHNQLVTEKVFFLNADETSFIVKSENKNFVFFANKKGERKKIEFTAKSFEKMYPGNLHYFEISNKKETHLKSKKLNVDIVRQKGGYEININSKKYFLVTSLANTSQIKRKIYANKFNVANSNYQLRKGALVFDL